MARFGIFLLIMGVGSLILPMMGRQFVLMSLLDPAQPVAGVVIAALGGLLIFLGAKQNA
jgi:hypothetical protein